VDVIGHQAVAVHGYAMLPALHTKYPELVRPVVVREENVLTVVPALCDMVRVAGQHDTSRPRHRFSLGTPKLGTVTCFEGTAY
jgi:hypothetical protein